MTREEKEQTGKYVFQMARLLEDGCYQQEMLLKAVHIVDEALEQEPRKGHWVHGEYCSECGCDVPAYIIDWKWKKDMNAKYCPNCGAKMEIEE